MSDDSNDSAPHSLVAEGLRRALELAVELAERKRNGEDMTPHRERVGDMYSFLLRLGAGKIPHDLFLRFGHDRRKLLEEMAKRVGKPRRYL
jgi:hypothetical protein